MSCFVPNSTKGKKLKKKSHWVARARLWLSALSWIISLHYLVEDDIHCLPGLQHKHNSRRALCALTYSVYKAWWYCMCNLTAYVLATTLQWNRLVCSCHNLAQLSFLTNWFFFYRCRKTDILILWVQVTSNAFSVFQSWGIPTNSPRSWNLNLKDVLFLF